MHHRGPNGSPLDTIRVVHVIVPEPEGSVGGADMHVLDLAAAQRTRGTADPIVFETLSPSYARRVRSAGVPCVSTAGQGQQITAATLISLMARADVVHAHGYDATWWAIGAAALIRRPPELVVTLHGWIETTLRLRALSALDRLANRLASGVIVVSDELVPAAVQTPARVRVLAVVPNGVRSEPATGGHPIRPRFGLPGRGPLVGAMGRLSPEKGHDVFVDACALIAARQPAAHFVLAGGGPLRTALTAHVTAKGLDDRFHLVGLTDEPEAFLAQLDVVVQPSDIETTSRVILEAMAQGRPVVATAVGGTASLISHGTNGLLVPRRCPEAIAGEVTRLLGSPATAARIGAAARLTVALHHDVSEMAAGVDDVYAAVLGAHPALPSTWVRPPRRQPRRTRVLAPSPGWP